jgi:type 1 glutamine amidotransferase
MPESRAIANPIFWSLAVCGAMQLACVSPTAAEPLWLELDGDAGPGNGKQIALIAADDEYRSEELIPQLAKILAVRQGFSCAVLWAIHPETGQIDPSVKDNIPGMELLAEADLLILFARFRQLPDDQMRRLVAYLDSGKPIIGLRTSTHAFAYPKDSPSAFKHYDWQSPEWNGGFGRQVLGETWVNHYGAHNQESTRGLIAAGQEGHPIVRGCEDIWGPSDVYGITTLQGDCTPIVMGQVLSGMNADDPPKPDKDLVPIAWTKAWMAGSGKAARIFTTTMGHAGDLQSEGFRRLLVNAVFWCLGMESSIPDRANVEFVGDYNPTPIGFGAHRRGLKPADHSIR